MNTLRTRIARLTAASILALGLGALASGPAFAAEGEPVRSTNGYDYTAVEDGAGTNQLCTVYSWANCIA